MRNTLPMSGAHRNESGIVNLDDATRPGLTGYSLGSVREKEQSRRVL